MEQHLKIAVLTLQLHIEPNNCYFKQRLLERVSQKVYANFAWSCCFGQKQCC